MKKISTILSCLLLVSSFALHAQTTPEKKPYTAGSFLRDATLITCGSCLLGVSAFSVSNADRINKIYQASYDKDKSLLEGILRDGAEDRAIQRVQNKCLTIMRQDTIFTFLTGAIGFAMVNRGIGNMFKHD